MLQLRSVRRGIFATRLLLSATALVGTMVACSDDPEVFTAPPLNTNLVVVTPRVTSLRVGQTQQLAASLVDKNGAPVSAAGAINWKSLEPTIASVSDAGLVTMLTTGTTAIQATVGGVTGIASLQGVAAVATISIAGLTRAVAVGERVPLSFRTLDAAGNALIARAVTWSSSAPAVATVSADGVISGIAPGTAVLTATSEGRTATANVVVEALAPVNTVTLTPATQTLAAGSTQQLVATLRDANNNVLANRPIAWASSSTTGTVSSAGLVTAVVPGTFTVTATAEGKSGSLTFNPLLNNTPLTIAGPLNSAYSWFITVPAGATGITVTLAGAGSQDPDLEVYRPGTTTPACVSEAAGPSETCTITTTVSAGAWRVRVVGYTAYSGVTLRAVVTP
ncbi:MAG: Ig-like domain-containing protein [Gemmatimonadota bacterium]|nr:Ig-like domain-containing protein [Gemmatimonadota bacterium]MDQ8167381.1 Ig-like domain-containing protein [Gemmatimonadota bacterium]MDQ8172172.1 Ig-like domain-containing protein [Gemmatimonadota bacterium]